MANLDKSVTLRTRGGSGETHAFPVASGVTLYNGSLCWLDNTLGRVTDGSPTGTTNSSDLAGGTGFRYDFLGIATPSGDSVTGDADGTVFCPVNCGGVVVEGCAVHNANTAAIGVGSFVFPATNNVAGGADDMKLAAASTNSNRAIGHIIRWHSQTNQDIKLYTADVAKFAGKTDHLVS